MISASSIQFTFWLFSVAVVDRDVMWAFLEADGLEIVWLLVVKKVSIADRVMAGGECLIIGGYRFNSGSIQGRLDFEKQAPGLSS